MSWISCACPPLARLFERRDCVIVASVSCIYGLGSPEAYYGMLLLLEKGQKIARRDILRRLVEIQYERNDLDFRRGAFRVRGDVIEVFPTYEDVAYRIEMWGDQVENLAQIDPLFGQVKQTYSRLPIYPRTHYVLPAERKEDAVQRILQRTRVVARGARETGKVGGGPARRSAHPCSTSK